MSNVNKLGKINEPIQILKKIQKIAPGSIIAGGYFRDKFNDIPFSDIDIYIESASSSEDIHSGEFWEDYLNLKIDDFRSLDNINVLEGGDEEYNIEDSDTIMTVLEMIKNQLCYNIIIVNINPVDYIFSQFDFGICKTYCDGKKVTFSKEFMADVENKTLTFTDKKVSQADFNHALDVHLAKIQRKYPNYTLVMPETQQQLYRNYKKIYT